MGPSVQSMFYEPDDHYSHRTYHRYQKSWTIIWTSLVPHHHHCPHNIEGNQRSFKPWHQCCLGIIISSNSPTLSRLILITHWCWKGHSTIHQLLNTTMNITMSCIHSFSLQVTTTYKGLLPGLIDPAPILACQASYQTLSYSRHCCRCSPSISLWELQILFPTHPSHC